MTNYDTLHYGVHQGLATIELARPQKLNAMSIQMFKELSDATEQAAADPGIRVVLLKGRGRAFCSGIDIALVGQFAGTHGARSTAFVRSVQRPYLALAQMEKPTVAAVHGYALGPGFQLALACDLRVAAEDIRFAMPEVRFGLIPYLGGTQRLARLVGTARAKEITWTGRTIEAAEAERIGLVNRVVPAERLQEEAEAYARELVASPPIPLSLSKALLGRAEETPFETGLEREIQSLAVCTETRDHSEAVEAFLEKRPPRFVGR